MPRHDDLQGVATMHDHLLVLRSTDEESREYLADQRSQPALYWGPYGGVAVDAATATGPEPHQLLMDAAGRVMGTKPGTGGK